MNKPILCLDFDGVIHSYTSGWIDVTTIPDAMVEGCIEFMLAASTKFSIAVVSSRGRSYDGKKAMRNYIIENLARWKLAYTNGLTSETAWEQAREWLGANVDFQDQKPSAFVTLDDRAITFLGKWPSIQELLDFKPWMKRDMEAEHRQLGADLGVIHTALASMASAIKCGEVWDHSLELQHNAAKAALEKISLRCD